MTDFSSTYPDLVNVEDWLNAKGYTGEAGACHQAMSLIRSQEKRIADLRKEADMMHSEYKTAITRINELEAALKPFANVAEEVNADKLRYCDIEIWVAVADLRAACAALDKTPEDWSHKNDGWR
jgi:hypothetical protein